MSLIRNVSLVKEVSRPEIYFVCGGTKMWIPDPAEFNSMGFDWNKVHVVPDGALANYLLRPFVALPPVKPSQVFFDVPDQWGFGIPGFPGLTIKYVSNARSSGSIAQNSNRQARNVMLAGWLWFGEGKNHPYINIGKPDDDLAGTLEGVEDVLYEIDLDPDFIERMYGPNGLSTALTGMFLQGHTTEAGKAPIPVEDLSEVDGRSRGVTFNSFFQPTSTGVFHLELNAWHVHSTNYWYGLRPSTKNYLGRGPAPASWRPFSYTGSWGTTYGDNWFPYDPLNPDNQVEPLRVGDYVLIKGTFWEDPPHDNPSARTNWFFTPLRGHDGWLEIHPIDWIMRVKAPLPGSHRTGRWMSLCTAPSNQDSLLQTDPPHVHWQPGNKFYPAFNTDRRHLKVREVEEIVDGRYTDMSTVWKHFVLNNRDNVEIHAGVKHSGITGNQGRFKASYLMTWEVPGPAVCSSNPEQDRLDLITRGTDDAYYYKWIGGNPWTASPWNSLNGVFTSDPAVFAFSPSLMYVFGRGTDNAVWFTWLNISPLGFVPAGWRSLGGICTSSPAVCSPGPDRITVCVRGTDKALWYRAFDGRNWGAWTSLGGILTSDPAVMAMNGVVWIFVRGTDDAIYFIQLDQAGGVIPWQRVEGFWTSAPAACSPDPAREVFELFARGSDNALWHRRFDRGWLPWRSLGGEIASDPAAVAVAGSTSWVFARGTDAYLYARWLTPTSDGPWGPLDQLPPGP